MSALIHVSIHYPDTQNTCNEPSGDMQIELYFIHVQLALPLWI